MHKILLSICCFLTCIFSIAQIPNKVNQNEFKSIEKQLIVQSNLILNAPETIDRFRADSLFTKGLVQALRRPNSFEYPFDSLLTISKIYAPDSSFRIFTWQVMKDFSAYHQKGAIQMNTKDGSLKLFPLFDFSEYTDNPYDSIRDAKHWIGAVYYNIVLKTFNGKNYYTLLGYDENNAKTTKKWMDVLTFDALGNPWFGGKIFIYPNDEIKPQQPAFRFCLEFKKQAGAKLNYDSELDKIIFAHLVSENGEIKEKQSLIPYGTYEGFHWANGNWIYEKEVE